MNTQWTEKVPSPNITVTVSKSKLKDSFLEDHSVDVEPHHVEEEEVPHLGLLHDDVDALLLDQSEPQIQQVGLHFNV